MTSDCLLDRIDPLLCAYTLVQEKPGQVSSLVREFGFIQSCNPILQLSFSPPSSKHTFSSETITQRAGMNLAGFAQCLHKPSSV